MTREPEWQHCLDQGLIVCAFDDAGRWACVMAGAPAEDRRFDGMGVWELFLTEPLRGRGLAAVLQRNFIDECARRLPGSQYVVGAIDGENHPSLRTAFSCGRRVLESQWFLR